MAHCGQARRSAVRGLDGIRRTPAHRVPDEYTRERHPSRRLRESEKQRTLRREEGRGVRESETVTLSF